MPEESVYKYIELTGVSGKSWEQAINNAITKAAQSLRDLRVAEVITQDVRIEDNKITECWGVFEELKFMQQLGVFPADSNGKPMQDHLRNGMELTRLRSIKLPASLIKLRRTSRRGAARLRNAYQGSQDKSPRPGGVQTLVLRKGCTDVWLVRAAAQLENYVQKKSNP